MASLYHFGTPLVLYSSMTFLVSMRRDRGLQKQQPNLARAMCLEGNIALWYLELHMNRGAIQSCIQGSKLKPRA